MRIQFMKTSSPPKSILDFSVEDLLFAHWLKRKREHISENKHTPFYIESELDRLRPLRNPNHSVFVLDQPPMFSV